MKKRLLSLLLAVVLVLGMLPVGAFATETVAVTNCLSVVENAVTNGTIKAGEIYSLKLSDIFADAENHNVEYSFTTAVENEHIKIKNGEFLFSAAAGSYEVTLTAKCDAMEASHKLMITVDAGNAGIVDQYNYNETDASSVTVYVTLSNDGYPVAGTDGTTMSHLEVTVPYFDLALYGMEAYYRYGTDNGSGPYTNTTVVKRPTGLHLYIYLLERYYMGLDEEACGKGTSNVLNYNRNTDVLYMDGTNAYQSDGKQALQTTGGATSIYMVNFWGHDENLMYFRNHCYPYMSPGWGSTSDYILLSDGDTWDVAMFSNWEFHNYGYFAKFDKNAYEATAGESVTAKTQKWGTSAAATSFVDVNGLTLGLYTDEWELVEGTAVSYSDGSELTFTAPQKAGTYYLMAMDPNAKDAEEACIAPATAIVTVKAKVECENCADENSDRVCDVCGKDLNNLPILAANVKDTAETIQTGMPYQLDNLIDGKIFEDTDEDKLSYFYRKSSDNGQTWGEWTPIGVKLEHGGETKSLINDTQGVYQYEFKANDGYGDSADRWFLTLNVLDVVPANIKFYLSQDQNYNETTHPEYPILELYRTAGLDENLYDYVGWFEKDGKTVYVYNPQDYTIIDGEKDYVAIDEVQYELHDYEKITFTNSAFDDSDETATDSGTLVDDYNMFYATITTGRYSTRGYGKNPETGAYDVYLGGQSMELPREKDIYGNGGDDIYLRLITVHTTSKKLDDTYFTANDYYVEMIMPITGSMIHSGDPFVSGNYTKYPFLSWASGNGSLYNYYAYPYDTDNYIFAQAINATTSAGKTVVSKTITIGTAIPLAITVPESGEFGLYFQYNNFNTKIVEPYGEVVHNADGTKTINYKVTKNNGNYTWRLTDPSGKYVTKSGWLKNVTAETQKTITFSEFTDQASHDFSKLGTAVDTRDEADIQVFLSGSGFKSVQEKTRIRAYRMWQLINSDTANIMIEPDFNIQVLQGNPVDITLVNGGNAMGNWIDVLPTTTDIVAVNYDALEVYTSSDNYGSHGGFFPATNPERTNVFIITNETAGTAAAHVAFNGSKETDRGTEWDYNYDTWFYLDSDTKPVLDFTVTGTGNVDVSYATVITDSNLKSTLSGWTSVQADANGSYQADLLKFRNAGTLGGTVIIKTTDSTGTSYLLIRVAEMKAIITNQTVPGEAPMPGNTIKVTFENLYRSVNKISGIFNPTKYNLMYTLNGEALAAALAQYQQMDLVSYTIDIPMDLKFSNGADRVEYVLTNGYVDGGMYSAASPFQTMYYITDSGVGTNFSAVGTVYVLSKMADIPITITKPVLYDLKLEAVADETVVEGATFTLTGPNGEKFEADENGIYQDLPVGNYTFTFAKLGCVSQQGTLSLAIADAESVVNGILTKRIQVVKAAENAWDGVSYTEPKAEDGIYQIGTGAELAWFAQTVNAGQNKISAVLIADIDLAAYNWTPIGNSTVKYSGFFDGQGHEITNLSIINDAAATGVGYGLFGYAEDATIQNLYVDGEILLTNSASVSNAYTGGIVGANTGTITITNVHSAVNITITRVKGNWARVGGIIGSSNNATITNCSNSGNIAGYQYIGGIAGYNTKGTISNCCNTGNVSGYSYVAGIAASCPPGNVANCYNTGAITATNNYVAGIVSSNTGASEVTNCFNIGKITFGGTSSYAGSVIGNSGNSTGINANLYYLEGSYSVGIGTNKNTVDAIAVSAEMLASAEFVSKMNAGLESAAFIGGKDGYPILAWQGSNVITGDMNADDVIDQSDVTLLFAYVMGQITLNEQQLLGADVNGDNTVDQSDVTLLFACVMGQTTI